jgi:hypothetical protein
MQMTITNEAIIQSKLNGGVEAAEATMAKIATNLTKSLHDAEYQLRWLQDSYRDVRYGQLCEFALRDGIKKVVAFAEEALRCWSPERSSSAYANAANLENFDALKRFIEDFKHYADEVV